MKYGIRGKKIMAASVCFIFFPHAAAAAGALINEVMATPAGGDAGNEWIEIYNSGNTAENLSGWQLYPDGAGYFSFPAGFSLGAKKFAVVHLRASGTDSAADLYDPAAGSNMGNSAGSAALFSGASHGKDTIKSFVQWGRGGQTWESAAADAGMWQKGSFAATSSEGASLGLVSDGAPSGASGWNIFALPTPGAANKIGSAAVSSPQPAVTSGSASAVQSPAGSSSSGNAASFSSPLFRVSAGGDRTVGVGSLTDFFGSAVGIRGGAPIENARFLWNFGDGEMKEGRSVGHIFQIPGIYVVGLHASSDTAAVSDYAKITVVPNQIGMEDVVSGADGFVRLKNMAGNEADIGEWIVEDGAGKKFSVPSETKVAAGARIALANRTTGLFENSDAGDSAVLYYSNLTRAAEWHAAHAPSVSPDDNQPRAGAAPAESPWAQSAPRAAAVRPFSSPVVPPPQPALSAATAHPASARSVAGSFSFFVIAGLASAAAALGFFLLKPFF